MYFPSFAVSRLLMNYSYTSWERVPSSLTRSMFSASIRMHEGAETTDEGVEAFDVITEISDA